MADTKRGSLILFCILILGMALAAGCGSDEDQTSPLLDTIPPAIPLDLHASSSPVGDIRLNWAANTVDPDLAGYIVYRSTSEDRGYQAITSEPVVTNAFIDAQATPGKTYWYQVSARDVHQNESARSHHARVTAADGDPIRESR